MPLRLCAKFRLRAICQHHLGRVDIGARGHPNRVSSPLDSRFRGNDGVEIGNGGAETRYLASHAIRAAPKIGQATMRAIPKGYGVKDSCPAMDPANPNPRIPPIIISIILVVIAAFLSPLAIAERLPRRRVSDSARRCRSDRLRTAGGNARASELSRSSPGVAAAALSLRRRFLSRDGGRGIAKPACPEGVGLLPELVHKKRAHSRAQNRADPQDGQSHSVGRRIRIQPSQYLPHYSHRERRSERSSNQIEEDHFFNLLALGERRQRRQYSLLPAVDVRLAGEQQTIVREHRLNVGVRRVQA